ncbi:flagellin [Desulfitobacterium sp. LBE]|uniref:Flagellin n=1 Tax=Desulfitobacterium hafniense DP7 TaxID=537010 RepID=G9XUP6_DESHA|nr:MULTISPECIES: flagellin [Desulfitobacterium]EHL04618.1 flagellin protein [Desulfitobacterium hafniense DP7]TWH60033.1 flagellin [Desulfitobacterium sp. LBE]
MIINHNMSAINTYRQLTVNNSNNAKSLEKLSSGLRINRAGDDAAGLAISEKMRGQIRGLDQAQRNAQDSISLIQTAEGALNETHSILQRMRELAVQASNDTNSTTDRDEIQKEINQLTDEIDRIANTTEFNTQKLIDGSKKGLVAAEDAKAEIELNTKANITGVSVAAASAVTGTIVVTRTDTAASGGVADFTVGDPGPAGVVVSGTQVTIGGVAVDLEGGSLADLKVGESVTISIKAAVQANDDVTDAFSMQIGANSGQNILVGMNSMKADDIGVRTSGGDALDVTSYDKATAAIKTINNAIELVSAERSKLGAVQNRLEHTINNLGTSSENLTAAESRIRDVDMAKEMMNFQKNNILSQAAQAMLAQANQQPQGVLQLLR